MLLSRATESENSWQHIAVEDTERWSWLYHKLVWFHDVSVDGTHGSVAFFDLKERKEKLWSWSELFITACQADYSRYQR